MNPNEKQPKTDEFSLTFERELFANTSARVTGVYARNFNQYALSEISRDGQYTIPITNLDPGPDGRLGTGDDTGQSVTYYEYPTSLRGAANAGTMIDQQPGRGCELQDLRSRGHETARPEVAARLVVLEHVGRRPELLRRQLARGSAVAFR